MTTSKSPLAVAQVAYAAAGKALPSYSHGKSPHKFTLPQLAACLVLKEFFATDYRGIAAILEDTTDLRRVLELTSVPHFTTLQKAATRLTARPAVRRLIMSTLAMARRFGIAADPVRLAALDGTGFESRHVSRYFTERRNQDLARVPYARFPKAGILADTSNHLVITGIPALGPRYDIVHFKPALDAAAPVTGIMTLAADAGYDSEANHTYAREKHGIRLIAPAYSRRWKTIPRGRYRRQMYLRFPTKIYRQRWQIETVMSMLKRNFGSFLRARSYRSQCREILLRLVAHNVLIVRG